LPRQLSLLNNQLFLKLLFTFGPWNLSSSTQLFDLFLPPWPKKLKLWYVGIGGRSDEGDRDSRLVDLAMMYLRRVSRFVNPSLLFLLPPSLSVTS
jgi:hypothetical protein